jgi:hypothetical protein
MVYLYPYLLSPVCRLPGRANWRRSCRTPIPASKHPSSRCEKAVERSTWKTPPARDKSLTWRHRNLYIECKRSRHVSLSATISPSPDAHPIGVDGCLFGAAVAGYLSSIPPSAGRIGIDTVIASRSCMSDIAWYNVAQDSYSCNA